MAGRDEQVLPCQLLLEVKHVDAGYRPLNFGFFTLRFADLTTEIDEIHTETPLGTCTLLLGAAPIEIPPFGAVAMSSPPLAVWDVIELELLTGDIGEWEMWIECDRVLPQVWAVEP